MSQPVDILLIEDNPSDLRLTLRALQQNQIGQHVEVLRDGATALDFLFRTGEYASRSNEPLPKLVLIDLKLPKVDGLEVVRKVKADPRTKRIPIIILTSSQEERDIIESYELGVNSYIVKPVEFEQFESAIRQVGVYWLTLNEPPH